MKRSCDHQVIIEIAKPGCERQANYMLVVFSFNLAQDFFVYFGMGSIRIVLDILSGEHKDYGWVKSPLPVTQVTLIIICNNTFIPLAWVIASERLNVP